MDLSRAQKDTINQLTSQACFDNQCMLQISSMPDRQELLLPQCQTRPTSFSSKIFRFCDKDSETTMLGTGGGHKELGAGLG